MYEHSSNQRGSYFRLDKIVFHKWSNGSDGPWHSVLIENDNRVLTFPVLSDDDAKEVWDHMERNYHHSEDSEWFQNANVVMGLTFQ